MGFGGGARACLGKQLAMLETKIVLIKLFQRYPTIELEQHMKEWKMDTLFLYAPQVFKTILKK
jgi:cytochrome P450